MFADVAATMTPVFALGVVPVVCEMNAWLGKVMCSYKYTTCTVCIRIWYIWCVFITP